jgi:regulator of replication initiation timing
MEKSTSQVEKNVSASFGYVKKDMLMLNDAFSDLHDKIQHLSLNHAMLLEEITKLRSQLPKIAKKKIAKKKAVKKTTKKKASKKTTKKKKK